MRTIFGDLNRKIFNIQWTNLITWWKFFGFVYAASAAARNRHNIDSSNAMCSEQKSCISSSADSVNRTQIANPIFERRCVTLVLRADWLDLRDCGGFNFSLLRLSIASELISPRSLCSLLYRRSISTKSLEFDGCVTMKFSLKYPMQSFFDRWFSNEVDTLRSIRRCIDPSLLWLFIVASISTAESMLNFLGLITSESDKIEWQYDAFDAVDQTSE